MKFFLIVLTLFFVSSCSEQSENTSTNNPLASEGATTPVESYLDESVTEGEPVAVSETEIAGWTIITADEGNVIFLAKNDQAIVMVDEENDIRRTVTVLSPNDPFGAASLTDEDADSIYEAITYRNGNFETTDIDLDGTIDGIFNLEEKKLLVNFEDELYRINDDSGSRYIIVDGEKVPMVYKYGTYVPK